MDDVPASTPISFAQQIVRDYEARIIRQQQVLMELEQSHDPKAKANGELLLHALQHFSDLAVQRLVRLQAEERETEAQSLIAA
jgi:hypothetical protein